jgi:hypothetical protein
MAEGILFGVAQKMIENLGSQIFKEIGSLWGVKDEFEKIKNTVSTIRAVLLDAAEQQSHNHQVRDWLEKLRDAVYDADDLLGEFSTEAMRRSTVSGNKIAKEVRTFFSSSNQVAFRLEMIHKIKTMRKKLDAIAKDRKKFHLKEYHAETNAVSRKREPTHSFVREEEVIGREEDKKAIISLLLESNVEENVSVIPIVGIGGLGKTTLAQYVFNDKDVKKYFDLKMWVCVSHNFELKIIVEKIIASATGNAPINLEIDQLQSQLREKIDQKKYLLVLDDVWNEDREKWLKLKSLLMGGSKGSKIIITTRIRLVQETTGTNSPYLLKGLFDKQSWLLFEQMAFRKRQENINPKLETIGREIVGMCLGVPLVIRSIGSMLYFKETEFEWSCVMNNLLENITRGNEILPILKLSYDNLPSHLKSCFTYCSLFPKDYEMDKETMIQLWIVQGFIQSSNGNQQLEDIGDEYFKDLLWRSFFEEVVNEYGILKYKLHDLIHDLAQFIAGEECKLANFDGKNINEKIRHVSCPFFIDLSFIETLRSSVKGYKVRTFLLTFGENRIYPAIQNESTLNTILWSFKSLRALDIHGLNFTRVPNSIEKLIHLKYLVLNYSTFETLPDSITRLWNLQTLKLKGCANLKELPKNIKALVNLRHLDNSGCNSLSHMPSGLGQMTFLQTLPLFVVSNDSPSISKNVSGLGELNGLNHLRGTLEIKNLELLKDANLESKAAKLWDKKHLEKLELTWYDSNRIDNASDDNEKSLEGLEPHQNLKSLWVNGYGGRRFSNWLLTNLVDLRLVRCKRCRHLPPLSQLPFLESIYLYGMEDLEYISERDISEEVQFCPFFPSLNSLHIEFCRNLKGWWRNASTPDDQQHQHHHSLPTFPLLSTLQIVYCPNLISMPLFPNLEKLLFLNGCLKPLQHTMEMASSLPSSSPSPLSKLKSLALAYIESLPDEWLLNLNSLNTLSIECCPRLTSLSGVLRYLTSLERLAIEDCNEFSPLSDVDDDDGMEWKRLNCLRYLQFRGLPKLKSLPAGLQHIATLQSLEISVCHNLMSLPEWMSCLSSLKKLIITACPQLKEKYGRRIGEDWDKIAHIPHIVI